MAEPFVQSASENLQKLLLEDADCLQGVEDKVEELQDALDWILCFLRDADANQYIDKRLRSCVERIKEIAYEAEYVVEQFIFESNSKSHRGFRNNLGRYLCFFREAQMLHEAGSDIDSLKSKIHSLISRLQSYGIETTYAIRKQGRDGLRQQFPHFAQTYFQANEGMIINLDSDVSTIVAQLLDEKAECKVVAICGRDGLGKTTLAKKIYWKEAIRKKFEAFAWAYVPPKCQYHKILRRLLSDLTLQSSNRCGEKTEQQLIKELREAQQQKKCLVVLDSMSDDKTWDKVKAVFQVQGSGTRVLLTTQAMEVVEHIDSRTFVLKPSLLNERESLALLQANLGSSPVHTFAHDAHKMINMGGEMIKYCQGLPLAIVMLSGLLATKSTVEDWQVLHAKIASSVGTGAIFEPLLDIIYADMPYYLRPCFLHLASFVKGSEIATAKLCHIWVAEGFIASTREFTDEGSLDDVAEHNLMELIQRGLVLVGKRGSAGRIKTCCLHDVVSDFCASKAKEENFLNIILHCREDRSYHGSNKNRKPVHRLAVYSHESMDTILTSRSHSASKVKSLLYFQENAAVEFNNGWLRTLCREFQWLRVLDFEGATGITNFPMSIGTLIHLRFLCLKGTSIRHLPLSLGSLGFLETLDLRVSRPNLFIPDVLWQMKWLRHLMLPYYNDESTEKLRLDTLSHLETLKNFDVGIFYVNDLLNLCNVRRLSVNSWLSKSETFKLILNTPSYKSGKLNRLSLRICGDLLSREPAIFSDCKLIKRLAVMGKVAVPLTHQMLPMNLEVLSLKNCWLEHDPMTVLEKLPRLKSLVLDWNSFLGNEMVCSAGGFPELIYLKLDSLRTLKEWKIGEGAMAKLQRLEVKNCVKLNMIPDGLPRSVEVSFHIQIDRISREL